MEKRTILGQNTLLQQWKLFNMLIIVFGAIVQCIVQEADVFIFLPTIDTKLQRKVKESKREEIQDIVCHGATYTWLDEDIYAWIIKSLQVKQKNMKKKSITSICLTVREMLMVRKMMMVIMNKFMKKVETNLLQVAQLQRFRLEKTLSEDRSCREKERKRKATQRR